MAQTSSSVGNLRSEDVQALKPWIDKKIKSILGFGDDTIVTIVVDALNKQKSRLEIQSLLQDLLENQTENFLNDLYSEIPKVRDSKSSSKRKREEDGQSNESDKKKIRESSDRDRHRDSDKSSRDRRDKDHDRDRERDRDKERDRDRRHDKDDRDRHHRDDKHRSDRDRDHKSRKRSRSRSRSRERRDRDRKESSRKDEKSHKEDNSKNATPKNGASNEKEEEKPKPTNSKIAPLKVPIKSITVESSKVPTEAQQEEAAPAPVAAAPVVPVTDISSLLAELQASKQALQQQLEQQKQEQLQTALLKKKLEQRKVVQKTTEVKKEKEPEKKEEKEKKKGDRESKKSKKEKTSDRFIPPPLLLDEKGREVDAQGNVIQSKIETVATLKANIKLSEEKAKKQKGKPEPAPEKEKKNQFIDPNLVMPKVDRRRRAFSLTTSLVSKRFEDYKQEEKKPEAEAAQPTPMEVEKVPEKKPKKPKDEIPDIEWWDKFLLQNETYDDIDQEKFKFDDISFYVEHPVPVKPPSERLEVAPMPLFLTKKEQKKLRRRTRMDRMKEKQELVMLGLEPPPKPKVKISNLMRVLTSEATADPTLIEQEVRRQMAERVANHEARNLANKLTPEERREKKKEKLMKETKKGLVVAVFRVNDLTDPKHKFKVDITVRDLQITGCTILTKDYTVIIAEAGAKAMKQFKKLMLKRIDWTKSVEDEKTEEKQEEAPAEKKPSKAGNKCVLVWEGTLLKQNFENFRFESFPDEAAIRKYLVHHWSEHLWDIAKNYKESEMVL